MSAVTLSKRRPREEQRVESGIHSSYQGPQLMLLNLKTSYLLPLLSVDPSACLLLVLLHTSTGIPRYSALHLALLPKSTVVQYYVADFSF
jgi:hypothetical protein